MLEVATLLGLLLFLGCNGNLLVSNKGQCFHKWSPEDAVLENEEEETAPSECRETPLHRATANRREPIEKLLTTQQDMYVLDCNGKTPIHIAIDNEYGEALKIYVKNGLDINRKFLNGNTVLHYAVANGKESSLKFLVEHTSEVDTVNDYNETPLTKAIEKDDTSVMMLLLRRGADVRKRTRGGETYLHTAAGRQRNRALGVLLALGLEAGTLDESGESAGAWAARADNVRGLQLLGAAGAGLRGLAGQAARCGAEEALGWLLAQGAGGGGPDGWTPLHWAARYGRAGAARLLLRAGHCHSCPSRGGHSPLWWALVGRHPLVVALLRAHGATFSREDLRFARKKETTSPRAPF